VPEKTIDFYSKYRDTNSLKRISPILRPGPYTLKLQVLGEYPGRTSKDGMYGGSTGDYVAVDRVSILQGNRGTPTPSPALKGDANNSGGIDSVDALLIARYDVGLNPAGFDVADNDGCTVPCGLDHGLLPD
jgi:hypothetical protein